MNGRTSNGSSLQTIAWLVTRRIASDLVASVTNGAARANDVYEIRKGPIMSNIFKSSFLWQFAGGFVLGAIGLFAFQPAQATPLALSAATHIAP